MKALFTIGKMVWYGLAQRFGLLFFGYIQVFQRHSKSTRLLVESPIHAPPFPNFTQVTMTLLSVVQSIAFAGVLSAGFIEFAHGFTWRVIEYIVASCFLIGLWHRYVHHHQFVGWQLTIWDTLLLMLFGVAEGYLVATLSNPQAIGQIHTGIMAGFLVGTLAYWYSSYQMKASYVKEIYKKHYGALADDIYRGMLGYERQAHFVTSIFALCFACIAYACWWQPLLSKQLSYISVVLFVAYLGCWDLNLWLTDEKRWKRLCQLGGLAPTNSRQNGQSALANLIVPSSPIELPGQKQVNRHKTGARTNGKTHRK